MDKDEALKRLAKEWKEKGVTGSQPTLWDLALALAREGVTSAEDGDESPAGGSGGEPDLPKAE
jgi:hypothetical protein